MSAFGVWDCEAYRFVVLEDISKSLDGTLAKSMLVFCERSGAEAAIPELERLMSHAMGRMFDLVPRKFEL